LFLKGIDSDGKSLRSGTISALINNEAYAAFTIEQKEIKGQPTDRVTLKDSGDFYRSFNVQLRGDEFIITADTLKTDNDLLDVWGDAILGLTDENLEIIIELAKDAVVHYIREYLLT
jgi:hypothetical protein